MFLKLFYTSSTHLQLLAHIANLSRRKVVGLKYLLYDTPGLVFLLEFDINFLPIPLLIIPHILLLSQISLRSWEMNLFHLVFCIYSKQGYSERLASAHTLDGFVFVFFNKVIWVLNLQYLRWWDNFERWFGDCVDSDLFWGIITTTYWRKRGKLQEITLTQIISTPLL
jgi:hypothetical protein